MAEATQAVTWQAPEHTHYEKTSDWFWVLGILAGAGAIATFLFGNFLLAILILVAAFVMALLATKKPRLLDYAVTARGIRIGEELFTYNSLHSFHIDEVTPAGPQLLVRSKRTFMPLLVIPLPEEYVDEIDDLIGARVPEEELEEPFFNKLLEFAGF